MFHAVKHLIDSICMNLQSTKDISCFLIRLLLIKIKKKPRIIMIENMMIVIVFYCHQLCDLISPGNDKRVFFLQCRRALIFYLRNQGCRPPHPPSQHPALIHFQQILHRLTSSWISWGFVTVPGWELISWKPRSVCVLKLESSRYQSNWSRRKTAVITLETCGFFTWPFSGEARTDRGAMPLGDVTHIKRFKTVSELKNFISLTGGRVLDHPHPRQQTDNKMRKDITS